MALDKNLIGQVKQACIKADKSGLDIGLLKLAFRGRPLIQRPVFQRRQPVYQQPAAPAPAPAPSSPYDQGPLPSEDTAASRAMYQPAPAGMQRFRNSQTGEVFYAPDQNAASAYVAGPGGNAAQLGIKPGQRVDTGYQQQMDASAARARTGRSPMDDAIEEARRIRLEMQAKPARPSAPINDSNSKLIHPGIKNMGMPAAPSTMFTQTSPAIPNMGKGPPMAPKQAPQPTRMRSLISSKPATPPAPVMPNYAPIPEINTGMPFGGQ